LQHNYRDFLTEIRRERTRRQKNGTRARTGAEDVGAGHQQQRLLPAHPHHSVTATTAEVDAYREPLVSFPAEKQRMRVRARHVPPNQRSD
jgi:hypothetical protein